MDIQEALPGLHPFSSLLSEQSSLPSHILSGLIHLTSSWGPQVILGKLQVEYAENRISQMFSKYKPQCKHWTNFNTNVFTSLLGSGFLILVCWSKTIKLNCICCFFSYLVFFFPPLLLQDCITLSPHFNHIEILNSEWNVILLSPLNYKL